MPFELKSQAFSHGEYIPKKYTGEGEDISPGLYWKYVPTGTKSFALICDDPDASGRDWVHWVIYDIPGEFISLNEGIDAREMITNGINQGKTDFGAIGYDGPMPPSGNPHRYLFKLYALNIKPNLDSGLSKQELLGQIQLHVLGEAELMGLYKR